ncbi:hypothetical protein [Streptosporangium sp. NBC_01756]|uniref:hypothetical protein n=1 Tax=Streptosporangium sp. NBC_01756 TaxID=2975950 RepID=UPI002DDA3959|nr:hypothetical protein [Streptosporangium sp. NBC_01756]
MPSGHLDSGESASTALIREAAGRTAGRSRPRTAYLRRAISTRARRDAARPPGPGARQNAVADFRKICPGAAVLFM